MALSVATASMESSIDHNSESSSVWEPFEVEEISWIAIVLGVISLTTIVGNIFVMVSFVQDTKIRNTVSNIFILNLSIADCIVGIAVLPINTSWVLLGHWPYGKMFCQIWIVIDYTTAYMSVLMITLISLDRFWLVTKKLKYRDFQTRRQVKAMIAFCWVFSLTFYTVVTFAWEPIVGESVIDYTEDCEMESLYNTPFNLALMFMEFIIPLIIISILNSIVYANIKRRSKGMVKPPSNPKPPASPATEHSIASEQGNGAVKASTISLSVSSLASDKSQTSKVKDDQKKEFNRHRKAAITLAVIVGIFLVCWLPYYVITIYTAAICEDCVSNRIWEIVNYILWCNSTINPLLYAVTNPHYRRNFARFLCIHKCFKSNLPVDTESSVM